MPRPKVRPEDRRRSIKACIPCKISKKRCDAQLPCVSCIKRGRAPVCVYNDDSTSSRIVLQRTPRRICPRNDDFNAQRTQFADSPNEHNLPSIVDRPVSPGRPLSLENRVLISSKGEKVYCGKLASLSFLQFLRKTLKRQMGPSPFTESDRKNTMLEADVSVHKQGSFKEDLADKKALVQAYFEATGAILDLFTRDEVDMLLAASEQPPSDFDGSYQKRNDLAALYVAIAIGGQCRGSNPADLHLATKYFAEGQKVAFDGMLRDPSLSMVRLFLLMAFYMLGACHRNAAFMYLGVASKAAEALGLHTPEYHRCVRDDSDLSIRTWKSLRILDLLVSAILGRHSSLSSVRYDGTVTNETSNGSRYPRRLAIEATFEACLILDEITQKLGKTEDLDALTAQRFLERLQHWSQTLPAELRQFGRRNGGSMICTDKELLIGNMHVACVYYFSVILVTRPFLISHLMLRLHNRTSDSLYSTTELSDHRQMLELAQACVSSASYLIQMCHKALTLGLLLKNMCMLKAWVFAAGLVLGFSLFPQEEARHDIEDAFTKSCLVLAALAELSPQAKHYHEILSNFAEAISKYQQRIAYERQHTTSQYVNQILDIEIAGNSSPQGAPGIGLGFDRGLSPTQSNDTSGGVDTDATNGNSSVSFELQQQNAPTSQQEDPFPDSQLLWDDPSTQVLGSFSLDYETFGMLFEGVGGFVESQLTT
ncbi:hypothetical protein VTO42DRAFT_8123 [Malbranchea cinnamomea]